MLTVGTGLLLVKKIRYNLLKQLNTLSSKQVKQLLSICLKNILIRNQLLNIDTKIDIKAKKVKILEICLNIN